MTDDSLAPAYAHCEKLARAFDRDRWLAALFAPAPARRHLHALAAFSYETGRLREVARQPAAGEIRLQWWREVLRGERASEARAHPVAAALLDTILRFRLPPAPFEALVEARIFDLYDDPMADREAFETYCGETASVLFRLAALVIAEGRDPGGAAACGHAGVAYATVGLLRALPIWSARGQAYLPADLLARHGVSRDDLASRRDGPPLRAALAEMRALARSHLADALKGERAPALAAALLPLAVLPLYLGSMERAGYSPFAAPAEAAQWRRQWALWRAARR